MNIVAFLLVVVAALFLTAYFTKRRYGVLGLALCAGYILSTMWADDVTPLVREAGINLLAPPLVNVVGVCLILLPAVLLFFSGPTYSKRLPRIIGAAAFALLATSFIIGMFGTGLNLSGDSKQVYEFLVDNRNYIITATIAYAIFDILTIKTPKKKEED